MDYINNANSDSVLFPGKVQQLSERMLDNDYRSERDEIREGPEFQS